MVSALLRLGLVSVGTLILAVFALFAVRQMGVGQGYSAPSHVWMERPFWWIFHATPEDLCSTKDVENGLPSAQWIVTLPLQLRGDVWVIPCTTPVPVKTFLQSTKHTDWLLQIEARETWSLDQLVEQVGSFDGSKHFAVITDSQKVAIFTRKKAPQWLFAADPTSLLRFRLFESLWIETAIDFWPDFVIATLQPHDSFHLDARGASEFERRKKRLIWEWDDKNGEEPHFPIQGIMTKRPSAAQQKFGTRL